MDLWQTKYGALRKYMGGSLETIVALLAMINYRPLIDNLWIFGR